MVGQYADVCVEPQRVWDLSGIKIYLNAVATRRLCDGEDVAVYKTDTDSGVRVVIEQLTRADRTEQQLLAGRQELNEGHQNPRL